MTPPGPLVAVVDYGIGNLRSAQKALERRGANAHLTADPALIAAADGVVLPGVGAFGACMSALAGAGLTDAVVDAATSDRPFLGICVGMQMLFEGSDENPDVAGLGLFPGRLCRLSPPVKIPQMQWNRVTAIRPTYVLDGCRAEPWFYFVHSYFAPVGPHTTATCDYGGMVSAVVELDNVVATQFHPEKSGVDGLDLLGAFVARVAGGPR